MTATLLPVLPAPAVITEASDELNIVFLLGSLGIGGAERQAIALAGSLVKQGAHVTIIALADGPLRTSVAEGVTLHILGRPLGLAPAAIPRLRSMLGAIRPDVIYAFLEVQWLLAAAARGSAALALGLRTGSYATPASGIRRKLVHRLVQRVARSADMLVANSASGLANFRLVSGVSVPGRVIPNGIDITNLAPDPVAAARFRGELGLTTDALVVGHVGRLDPVKNHELLIQSFAMFAATEAHAQLVCVGTGASHRAEALRNVADHFGMASRVHFTGARSDLAAVYSAFDMLALSSSREGFPNVVAEAMACGVPAVVTNAGASPEIVDQLGEVSATHTAADFSAAMTRLTSRRSSQLSTACRARVLENYTLERCVQHTLQVMQAINPRRTR